MHYDKVKYELLIAQSPLFTLDKEKEPNAYVRESLKMVENLYCYLLSVNEPKYEEFGLEITETASRCIKNYRPEAGGFLNYFNAAWKKAYSHATGKMLVNNTYSGIKFTDEEQRNIRNYMRLARSMGMDCSTEDFNRKLAEAMNISLEEAQDLIRLIRSKPVSDITKNESGEVFSLFDQIDSGSYADGELHSFDSVAELLNCIQEIYNEAQERQKPLLSKLITSKIGPLLADDDRPLACLEKMTYYDKQALPLSAREIADAFNINEASVSRTWKVFKGKIIQRLKEELRGWD